MKIVFAAVLYTGSQPYLEELINSINDNANRFPDFSCLFINDNYDLRQLRQLIHDYELDCSYKIVDESAKKLTPPELRIELLKVAREEEVDLLIVGDSDDTFVASRVEKIVEAYFSNKDKSFYYNDLIKADGTSIFSEIPQLVDKPEQVSQANFLGMSTTAINMKNVTKEWIDTLYEGNTVIFDWYLYTRLMLDFGEAMYVDEAATIYRIYEGNEVGTKVDVKREIEVKKKHYANLGKRYEYFDIMLEELNAGNYEKNTNKHGYWWEEIVVPNW